MPGDRARQAAQKDICLVHVFCGERAGWFMFKLGQPFQYRHPLICQLPVRLTPLPASRKRRFDAMAATPRVSGRFDNEMKPACGTQGNLHGQLNRAGIGGR